MNEMVQVGTVVAAICVPVTALLTVLCTKGVDGWVKMRKTKTAEIMEDRKYSDGEAAKAYDKLIGQFEARIDALEKEQKLLIIELKESRAEHVKCMVEHAALRGKFEALQVHVDRLWKHDEANKENVKKLKEEVEKHTEPMA